MPLPSESAPDAKVELPSELFRTIVSLLLIIHLFVVGLAIVTDSPAGGSALLTNIKTRTPGVEPYLWQLWFDHGYDYELINFMPMFDDTSSMDWPYHLEATLNYSDGRPPEVVEVPGDGVWPADRRERLQRLPKCLATLSQWQDGPTIGEPTNDTRHAVGGSIGAGLLREHPDASSVTLRWYYHRGVTGAERLNADRPLWTPTEPRYFATVGTMRVEISDDQPESMDVLPKAEVSPLKQRAGASEAPAATPRSTKSSGANAPAKNGATKTGPATDSSAPKSKTEPN
jgi:hypothetical protein